MNNRYKKLVLIWLGSGLILTTVLYSIEKNYNSNYFYTDLRIPEHRKELGWRSLNEKLHTYYQITGALTIGGALIISAFGLKENS